MKHLLSTAALALVATGSMALAEGDAAKGEADFKKCKACHSIVADDGTVIVKGGRTGPNLYGVIGRQAGTYPDFKYGESIIATGEAGVVWDTENIVVYMEDPKSFLAEATGDAGAKSKMTFKLKGGEDVAAYLASLAPAAE